MPEALRRVHVPDRAPNACVRSGWKRVRALVLSPSSVRTGAVVVAVSAYSMPGTREMT